MDSLEALGLLVLGWFAKKIKDIGGALIGFTWWLFVLAKPAQRCMVVMVGHSTFQQIAIMLHEAGLLRGWPLLKVKQFDNWAYPRLDSWQKRVRPPEKTA